MTYREQAQRPEDGPEPLRFQQGDLVSVTSGGEVLRDAEVTRVLKSGRVEVSGSSTRWRQDGAPASADMKGRGWKLVHRFGDKRGA